MYMFMHVRRVHMFEELSREDRRVSDSRGEQYECRASDDALDGKLSGRRDREVL